MGLRVVTVEGGPIRFRHAARPRRPRPRRPLGRPPAAAAILAVARHRPQPAPRRPGRRHPRGPRAHGAAATPGGRPVRRAPRLGGATPPTLDVSGLSAEDYQAARSFLLRAAQLDPRQPATGWPSRSPPPCCPGSTTGPRRGRRPSRSWRASPPATSSGSGRPPSRGARHRPAPRQGLGRLRPRHPTSTVPVPRSRRAMRVRPGSTGHRVRPRKPSTGRRGFRGPDLTGSRTSQARAGTGRMGVIHRALHRGGRRYTAVAPLRRGGDNGHIQIRRRHRVDGTLPRAHRGGQREEPEVGPGPPPGQGVRHGRGDRRRRRDRPGRRRTTRRSS